jgi:hypothetical protein
MECRAFWKQQDSSRTQREKENKATGKIMSFKDIGKLIIGIKYLCFRDRGQS